MTARRDVTIWCDGVRNDGTHTDDHAPGCPQHGPQGDSTALARRVGHRRWGWITVGGGGRPRDYSRACARELGLPLPSLLDLDR